MSTCFTGDDACSASEPRIVVPSIAPGRIYAKARFKTTYLIEPQGKLKVPKFVSTHAIACMTRQDVSRLLKRFKEEENADVINIRVLCDTLSGRLVCEWEARDSVTLIEWLKKCNVQIRGTGEWLMAVQYESVDDELVVPPRHNT